MTEVDDPSEDDETSVERLEVAACEMRFHVTDAKRVLASVAKMTEAGDEVQFGAHEKDCFVMNKSTGRKIFMKKEKNLFILDV